MPIDPEVRRERRDAWLAENGPCARCGSSDRLEVDHVDPATKDPLLVPHSNNLWAWSEIRRAIELAKCQPLCATCHREKSNEELTRPIVHGSESAYSRKGCRCDVCREGRSARRKAARVPKSRPPLPPTPHGTRTGYVTRKCRCGPCKAANSAYERERKNKKQ